MDEVKAMARAGESVGKAVGTGMRTARKGATRASHAGVEMSRHATARAEQELASHGISADELQERLAQRATGMSRADIAKKGKRARKRWEKKAEKSRKQLSKNTELARRELAAKIEPMPKKRRKWPWLLLVLAGLAAVAAVALSRRPEELPIAEAEEDPFAPNGRHSHNGSAPAGSSGVSGRSTQLNADWEG
ncbi:hypothetical protein [Parasphingorhabdus pacifica]